MGYIGLEVLRHKMNHFNERTEVRTTTEKMRLSTVLPN